MIPTLVASVALYATPTWPLASEFVVIVNVAEAIVKVKFADFVCVGAHESFTWIVSAALLTATVGVPLMTPVEAFNDKPAGNVPEVTLHA